MERDPICIVTPALADANNGNWQTARRWADLLGDDYRMALTDHWDDADKPAARLLIALHARRSADSIRRWRQRHPARPLVVVLTGTDLYRDIRVDADARRSLELADRLVVLHESAVDDLPPELRPKAVVCLQSTAARAPATARPQGWLQALMVGHLREEKSPRTYFEAARLLAGRADIRLDHVGGGLDAGLAEAARRTALDCPNYRWLGALPHAQTLDRIRDAHLLVHPSVMEGGAHVVMEAVRCGTPVLASRISGNTGLLGRDYTGLFEVGDAAGLTALLRQCRDEPAILKTLAAQCAARAPLFSAGRERAILRALLDDLLNKEAIR